MELLGSEIVFEGRAAKVAIKRYRRAGDGKEVERQVIEHPGSVAILAHDGEAVYLVRQPREAVEEDGLLEIPAGMLDVDGESELECAVSELREEVGLRAEQWEQLTTIYPSPGYIDEVATIFEATGLSEHPGQADDEELIEIVRLPVAEIDAALASLRDAKTVVALLFLKEKLAGNR